VEPSAPSSTLPSQRAPIAAASGLSHSQIREAFSLPDSTSSASKRGTGTGQGSPKRQKRDPHDSLIFIEFFAGEGGLTCTMKKRGVKCWDANDAASGGVDFEVEVELTELKSLLRDLRTDGHRFAIHFAPPCCTFSRARDRSRATQLRSTKHPGGLPGLDAGQRKIVASANRIALNAFDLAVWAARDLQAAITFENPATSYIWAFLLSSRPRFQVNWVDIKLSQCHFGTPYRKDRDGARRTDDQFSPLIFRSSKTGQGYHPSMLAVSSRSQRSSSPTSSVHKASRHELLRARQPRCS
jgi:hypothetical protein